MIVTTNAENLRQYKIRFSVIAERSSFVGHSLQAQT